MYEYSIDTGYVLVKKGNSHDKHSPSQKASIKAAIKASIKSSGQKRSSYQEPLPWEDCPMTADDFVELALLAEKTKSALRVRRHRSPDLVRLPST